MRRDVLLLLCSFYLLPLGAHADDSGLSAKDIKTLPNNKRGENDFIYSV